MNNARALMLVVLACLPGWADAETIVDFQELTIFNGTPPAGTGQYFNGYGAGADASGFTSKGVAFSTAEFGPGFSYSTVNNTTTPGLPINSPHSPAVAPMRVRMRWSEIRTGWSTLVRRCSLMVHLTMEPISLLRRPWKLQTIDLANATYAAIFLADGLDGLLPDFTPTNDPAADFDAAAQFGDGDFLRLTITGFDGDDANGSQTGQVVVDLANYGGAGTADDFVLGGWQRQDLSSFAATKSLRFSTSSSKFTDFGGGFVFSDVPAYAAIDNLTFATAVPEPSGLLVLAAISGGLVLRRRQRC